jgi:2-polyprenyl-6-methoxyphenol hydroxylase-like FAD-dependent oxidoreductase
MDAASTPVVASALAMRPTDIGIIGCGTAGSAAALLLARAGHRVTVYERVPEPGAIGAGVMLQPTGQAVLARLGLLDAVIARAAPVEKLRCETVAGRCLFDLRYDRLPEGYKGYGLHRGVLFDALFRAVKAAPVALRCGVAIENLCPTDDHRGLWFVTPEGERHGPHAMCVVADGARSHLRDDTSIDKRVDPYPWGALWFVGEDREETFARVLFQKVRGTRRMTGFLPTGLGPSGSVPLVSLFYSLRADQEAAWRAGDLSVWKREITASVPQAEALLAQIGTHDDVLFTRYHDVEMYPWNTDRVVYLGDAAHAMSPQLGQGANLALWDAMTLADECERHLTVGASLAAYSRARKRHLGFYQLATRWLTLFFQSDLVPLGWARDAFMPLAASFSPTHTLMVRSMTGTVQGVAFEDPVRLDPWLSLRAE